MSLRLVFAILVVVGVASPAGAAERILPCVPHEAVDGRCEVWAATHDGPGGDDSIGVMATSPNGWTVYGAGQTQTAEGYRTLLIAFDAAAGEARWVSVDGRAGDEYDINTAIAVSPDGSSVYTAGAACGSISDGSSCDASLAAHDAVTGGVRWSVRRDGAAGGLDSAQDVVVSEDGATVYLGGQTFTQGADQDYLVAAFDAVTGEELWSSRYDGPAHGPDRGADLVLVGDLLVMTGRSAGSVDDDMATVAFDTRTDHEGEIAWVSRYTGAGSDEAYALDAAGDRVLVTGSSVRAVAPDMVVVAYMTGTGEQAWAHRYDDPGIAAGEAFDVAVSPDGRRAIATGYTQRSDGKGPSTLGFDVLTGQRLWAANLQEGLGYAAAISPDGTRAYVTGGTYTRRGIMHRTISYNLATGAQRWAGLYEHTAPPAPLNDTLIRPSALTMSPDGTHVYVGGVTRPLGSQQERALALSYQA